jgi:excisionase family DNA binding protein
MSRKQEYVSAVEAARLTGLSERTIRRKIDAGELKAEKSGTSYAIRVRDLNKLTGQRPPTPDILLQRIQELEEIQTSQAAQIDSQAETISALERRVQSLEEHPTPAPTRTTTGHIPLRPVQLAPIQSQANQEPDEGRTPTQPLTAPGDLPEGSILAAHFARQYGINPRTFNDQIRAGRVPVTSIDRKGRPEHWLTPEQQAEIKSQRGL